MTTSETLFVLDLFGTVCAVAISQLCKISRLWRKVSVFAIFRQPRANRVLWQLLALQLQAERINPVRNDPAHQV